MVGARRALQTPKLVGKIIIEKSLINFHLLEGSSQPLVQASLFHIFQPNNPFYLTSKGLGKYLHGESVWMEKNLQDEWGRKVFKM